MFIQPPSSSAGRLGHAPASTEGSVSPASAAALSDALPVAESSSTPDSGPAPLDAPSLGPVVASGFAPEAPAEELPQPRGSAVAARASKRRIGTWAAFPMVPRISEEAPMLTAPARTLRGPYPGSSASKAFRLGTDLPGCSPSSTGRGRRHRPGTSSTPSPDSSLARCPRSRRQHRRSCNREHRGRSPPTCRSTPWRNRCSECTAGGRRSPTRSRSCT